MLFVATTINYVDRQVLSILKPILHGQTIHLQPLFSGWPSVETTINVTDREYGYILAGFQVAYALGVVFAGRLVDRLGCRRGYPLVTGLWSLAAMAHALVRSVMGFGIARFFLGLGESGNFPAAIKATAEWFPPKERALATGIFNSGAGVGAIVAPLVVPWVALHFGWRAAFLVTGIFSLAWIVWWSIRYRKPTGIDGLDSRSSGGCAVGRSSAVVAPAWVSTGMGIHDRQVPHGSGVVVLSVLAAAVFSLAVRARSDPYRAAAGCGICGVHDWQRLWRLAAEGLYSPGHEPEGGAACGDAYLRMLRFAGGDGGEASALSGLAVGLLSLGERRHTRAGRPISSRPLRTCFLRSMWARL